MGVDSAWNHIAASRIDDSNIAPGGDGLARMSVADDLAAIDPQVGCKCVARRDEGTVLDDRDHAFLRVAGNVAQSNAT